MYCFVNTPIYRLYFIFHILFVLYVLMVSEPYPIFRRRRSSTIGRNQRISQDCGSCRPLLVKSSPGFRRCNVADSGVTALPVVINFIIFKNSGLRLRSGRIMLMINRLQFDRAEKGLGAGVVVRHAFPVHAGNDVVFLYKALIVPTGILDALIRVVNQAPCPVCIAGWRRSERACRGRFRFGFL